jgi:hypothetical protein
LYPLKGTQNNVFWDVRGAAPARELVIEWRDVRFFDCRNDSSQTARFEVIFHEDRPDVDYEYADVTGCDRHSNAGSSTVGLQVSPDKGSTFAFGGSLVGQIADHSAVHWQPKSVPLPTNPVPTLTRLIPDTLPVNSDPQWITVQGTGFVPGSKVIWNDSDPFTTEYVSDTELKVFLPWFAFSFQRIDRYTVQNPAPGGGTSNFLNFGVGIKPRWIGALSPQSVVAGSQSFTLTITGENLTGTQYVYFANQSRPFQQVSDTELRATIQAGDIATAGLRDVNVFSGALGSSNVLKFEVKASSSAALPQGHLQVFDANAPALSSMLSRRFIGHSFAPKLGEQYARAFSRAYEPSGASALASPSSVLPGIRPAGYLPEGVAIADFNGDGIADWAVINGGDDTVWICFGNGDGTSQLPKVIALSGAAPIGIAAADLDADGDIDLAVAEADSGTVGVLRNRGDGTFSREEPHYLPEPPVSLVVADFNGDGIADIATGMSSTLEYGPIAVFAGLGGGFFSAPIMQPSEDLGYAEITAFWLVASDLNHDGVQDLLVADYRLSPGGGLWSYYGHGDGTFKRGQQILGNGANPAGEFVQLSADLADFDEDGCADLVDQETLSLTYVLRGNCDGTFTTFLDFFAQGDFAWATKAVDINGDGHVDIISTGIPVGAGPAYGQDAGTLLSVALGDGHGHFARPRVYRGGAGSFALAAGDLNGDGRLDVITANQDSDSVTVYLNNASGEFPAPNGDYIGYLTNNASGGAINGVFSAVVPVDVTGDGKKDLVSLGQQFSRGDLLVMPNLGNKRFGPPIISVYNDVPIGGTPDYVSDMVFGDFRATGKQDVLLLSDRTNYGTYAYFMRNDGGGAFSLQSSTQVTYPDLAFGSAADFNGDGRLDVAVVSGNALRLLLGDGTGHFSVTAPVTIPIQNGWLSKILAGDFDGDGRSDIYTWSTSNAARTGAFELYLLRGLGNGTFAAPQLILPYVDEFVFADVNHDGRPDIVSFRDPFATYPYSSVRVTVYLGKSDGTFSTSGTYDLDGFVDTLNLFERAGQGRYSSAVADYDGDGQLDIAVFQNPMLSSPRPSKYMQLLHGNGDGTFWKGTNHFNLLSLWIPTHAADLDNDGKAELIETDQFTSSFHIISDVRVPALSLTISPQPIIGSGGMLRVSLERPPQSAASVSLSSSDANVVVPSTATVPAGASSVDVPFTVGPAFGTGSTFSITGTTMYGDTATALSSRAAHPGIGPKLTAFGFVATIVPGQTTRDFQLGIFSQGGYSGVLDLRCDRLPVGASCQWDKTRVELGAGTFVQLALKVSTASSLSIGDYTFGVVASDGSSEFGTDLTFRIGDFTPTLSQSVATVNDGFSGQFGFVRGFVDSVNGYMEGLSVACSGLPQGAICQPTSAVPTGSFTVVLQATGVAPKDYPFTLAFSNGITTKSLSATLKVLGINSSSSSSSLTLRAGDSGTVDLTLNAPNGFDKSLTLLCAPNVDVTCSFDQSTISFSSIATVKVKATLTAKRTAASLYPRALSPLSFSAFGLVAGLLVVGRRRRLVILSILMLAALFTVSCGGGGGSSSTPTQTVGGSPGTGTGSPSTTNTTVSINVQSSDSSYSKQVATISVTIQK